MSDKPLPQAVSRRSPLRKALFAAVFVVLAIALLEGLVSFAWAASDLLALWTDGERVSELKEEFHCQYDEQLGWSHKPNTSLQDFYGTGRSITINQNGVRGLVDYAPEEPDGRFRLICLGDSFTLGYGVDDHDTFPQQLEDGSQNSLQVVNMGQGGYSVGQSYIWLDRLRLQLNPDAVVCVFIVEDFRRVAVTRTANGYSTPRFVKRDKQLVIENVPVPPKLQQGSLLLRPGEVTATLRRRSSLVDAIGKIVPQPPAISNAEVLQVGTLILTGIQKLCHRQGCPMTLVLTPTLPELLDSEQASRYQGVAVALSEFAEEKQIPFLDLRPEFAAQRDDAEALFLDEAFHHYSPNGNQLVADSLQQWLPTVIEDMPTVAEAEAED
jgi:lysophospholipase L1-like esterase